MILRKTISYDPSDPRVDLANGGSTFIKETRTKSHAPTLTPDEVGYVFVRFMLDQHIPNDAVSVTLTCKIGTRTDTFEIDRTIQKNVIWEISSDKYINQTSATYEVEVTVVGTEFTDPPVVYKSAAPTKLEFSPVRLKYVNPAKILLPPAPADQVATVNKYIKAFATAPA